MFEKVCIILLLNILFYLKTISYKYVSDDLESYKRKKEGSKFRQALLVLEGHYKSHPVTDHALTTLLHALVCVGIYLGFGKSDASFLAAILFSFNPSNNQGAVWISGRSYVLSALGMVWALAVPVLAPLFILLGTYFNAGFLMPLVFAGSAHLWFLLTIPLVLLVHGRRFKTNVKNKMAKEMFYEDKAIKWEKLVLATKTFGFYTALSIVPFKNSFYHSFLQSVAGAGKEKAYSFKDRFFWIGLILLIGIAYYFVTVPWNMVSFGILWWMIGLAPFLNFFRMQQEISERYMYLPNCGLMFVLASLIIGNVYLTAFLIGVYATKMWFYIDAYMDDYYLCEVACINSPDSWFAWHIRGMKRWDHQSYQEALTIWTMARIISPKEFKVNFNIATTLQLSGHKDEALQFLKIAEENIPRGQEKDALHLIGEWRAGRYTICL